MMHCKGWFAIATLLVVSAVPLLTAAQTGDTCQAPVVAQAGVNIYGDLNIMNSTSAIPGECLGSTAAGPDMFFSLAVTSGYHYDIQVKPSSTLNVAAAIWNDCTLSAAPCLTGSDTGDKYVTETLTIDPPADSSYIIQVVGVDAVTGATTSKSKFTMKITETQIAVDEGPGDAGGEDVALPVEIVYDAAVADDENDTAVATDEGPAEDIGQRDDGAGVDTAAPPPDAVSAADAVAGTDLNDWHDDKDDDGCGQGRTPAAMAPLLLLAALFVFRRTRFNA